MMKKIAVVLVLFLFILSASISSAQTPDSREQVVWGVLTSENDSYFGVFIPESYDIFLLAGVRQVLLPQKTNVYYWPITKEYKADWQSLDVPIFGTMQVKNLKTGSVEKIDPLPYMIFTDVETGRYILLSGEEATERYEGYLARRQAYLDAVSEYDTLFSQYQKEKETDPNAKAPIYPEPFSEYLTAPDLGYVTSFDSGNYEITILDKNGSEIEGAKRTVEVIEPKNGGYSYVVVPEKKWTYKQTVAPEDEVLYISRANENLYLQAQNAYQYNEYAYTKFRSPQSIKGSRSRMIWVSGDRVENASVQFTNHDGSLKAEPEEFRVIQNSGSKLGYQIRVREPDETRGADFTAYRIPIGEKDKQISYTVINSEDDSVLSDNRKVVIVEETFPVYAYLLILLPLAVFVTVKRIWK